MSKCEVIAIGGANMDIIGVSRQAVIAGDSNPGNISLCAGGVARNIAENLARLQVSVSLITALCRDVFGRNIVDVCEQAGVDTSHSYFMGNGVSSAYMAILGPDGDMRMAISDMASMDVFPVAHIREKSRDIESCRAIVMDTNLPEDVIEHVLSHHGDKRIFMDPVSVGKSKKIKRLLGCLDTLKCNKLEAEYLSGIKLERPEDYKKAGYYFLNEGLKQLFISLGSEGVYYQNALEYGNYAATPIQPTNATGAGDAFMAGVIYCGLRGKGMDETARFAAAMALVALKSRNTVSMEMSLERVIQEMKG